MGAQPVMAAGPGTRAPRAGRWGTVAVTYAPAAAAALVMAVLGVWGLARDSSMGNDEVATRWAALLSLHDLAHLLHKMDAVHGLYYLLMHVWVAVGSSPAVLRIPSVAAMTAAVAMVAILTRRLTGSGWAGLFAGLVMALTPDISFYAQTARSYALVIACVVGATLVLVHALSAEAAGTRGARLARWWLAYGALIALGGYLNEMSLLVLAAHGVTVLVARYRWQVAQHWAVTATVSAILVLPLVLISVREDSAVGWIPRPHVRDLQILFHDYFGATTVVALLLLVCAVIAVLPAGRERRGPIAGSGAGPASGAGPVASAWWRGGVSLPSVAAPLLLVPGLLLILESLVAKPLYADRYVLYGEAGAAMLAGAGMWRIGQWLSRRVGDRPALLWVPGVVICVATLVLQLAPQQRARTPQSRLFDFGGPSRYVGAHARQGDGVLFFGTLFRKARLGYPEDFTKTSDFAMARSPQRAGNFRGQDKSFEQTIPLMLAHQRIWVLGLAPSAQLPWAGFRAESVALQRQFALIAERHFRGIVVTLWQRR
jgi:mannosyltransferase